jgi:hypothetical protein
VVGGNSDSSIFFQASQELVEIFFADEASFVMSFFRPGVGEIDMETIDGKIGNKFANKSGGIGAEHPDVFEVPSAEPIDGVAVISAGPFDA